MGRLRFDFSGEVALVTGAASGIGLEVARELAEAGARVHGLDLRAPPERAWEASEPRFHEVDVRDSAAVDRAIARVIEEAGRLDHLVHCAGIARDGVLWKLDDERWREVLEVNLSGAFHVLRAAARAMRAAGRGRVVLVASINGLRGKFGQSNYCASKAGLVGLAAAASRELGPSGITVNVLAPGMVETPMTSDLPAEVRRRALEETSVGRLGEPPDIAAAVLFLLSDQARHVNGAVLRVDGGQLA
jgi:3-oxoacyl-[acyl-carrier protein] reductase